MACTSVPASFSQGGRSGIGCVSLAFRPRFACKWNAELTISKRVIGIFRLRFACLQNSPFPRILTAETQEKEGARTRTQIPDAGVFRIKGKSLTVIFLPASLRVSAVKLFIDLSKSAGNKRAKRPASDEINPDRSLDKYQSTRYARYARYASFSQKCRKLQIYEESRRRTRELVFVVVRVRSAGRPF